MKDTILKLAALLLLLSSFTANAVLINISGAADPANDGSWDITFVDGIFDTLTATLTAQVWWGDRTLAELFATTLQIGAGNAGSALVGPDFAWGILDATRYHQAACQTFNVAINNCGAGGQLANFTDSRTRLFTYATASPVPAPSAS